MQLQRITYVDKYHGHIVTDDLRIISDIKLRQIFCKGPKFKESECTDFEKYQTSFVEGIDDCINIWCSKK